VTVVGSGAGGGGSTNNYLLFSSLLPFWNHFTSFRSIARCRLPDNAAAALNGFVSLPALALKLRAVWRNPEDVEASYPKTSILKAGRIQHQG
jgi:hypothetical protein